ncbi:MAG: FAD-binding domain-containing protein [Candidatus Pelagibacter sp.]
MNFEASRAKAIDKLNNFVEKNLSDYSRLRNFDFGPDKRNNVSCLSPYVTHGVLNEIEIIKKSLAKFSFSKNEKFVQEVLWRTYWKGWLELRPNVWSDYLVSLNNIREKFNDNKDYLKAIEGNTNIECFNEWVKELKKNNYLHNHTRMWFASIWIFTLDLPWQLGAEFFMQHLYDGDAASNTLGWRWVAGVQTQGKHYLASEWNIKKFTNNRFSNIKLNENAPPKVSEKTYSIIKQNFVNPRDIKHDNLLIFENNLSLETTDFKDNKFKKIYLVSNKNENRTIKLSEEVIKFKSQLTKDQEQRLKDRSINCEIIDISEVKKIGENIVSLYPTVGENLDYLNLNNIRPSFLYRKLDQYSWQYCNKGFFNFKNYIPKIITMFT